jgi:hypothetical protein
VSLALRTELFERGHDISDPLVLEPIMRRYAVRADESDVASVYVDLAEGRRRGVIGSPHFFVADRSWFCPALDVHRDPGGRLAVRLRHAEFDDFMRSCFGGASSS